MGSEIEAKSICVHKLEDLLLDPMFTIFQVQHAQIASKTETKNTLIYHLKCSMTKVRTWNSSTVRDFCSNLVTRFPALDESFMLLFRELQELTCKILNQSSESSAYSPIREEVHTYLHSFISACSDAFISHIHWFAVEESSTEYQSCKNSAKLRMQQAKVVENTVMNFVKAGPKDVENEKVDVADKVVDKAAFQSDGSLETSDSEEELQDEFVSSSDDSSNSRTLGNKSIDLISGAVKDGEDEGPQFSTPFAKPKKQKTKSKVESEADLSSSSENSISDDSSDYDSSDDSSDYDSSDDSSDYDSSDDSSYDSTDDSSDDSDDDSSYDPSSDDSSYDSYDNKSSDDSSNDSSDFDSSDSGHSLSSFDTDFDCESSSSSGTGTETDDADTGSEGSGSSISAGSSVSVGEDQGTKLSSDILLDHILNLKRKENRHRKKKRNKEKLS